MEVLRPYSERFTQRHSIVTTLIIYGLTMLWRAAVSRGFRTPLHLFRRDVFLVRRDMPDMAERIDDCAVAIAIELVLQRFLHRRTGFDGVIENGINVFDIDHQAHG